MPPSAVTWPEHLLSPRASPQHLRAGGQGGRLLLSEGMPVHSDSNGGRYGAWYMAGAPSGRLQPANEYRKTAWTPESCTEVPFGQCADCLPPKGTTLGVKLGRW